MMYSISILSKEVQIKRHTTYTILHGSIFWVYTYKMFMGLLYCSWDYVCTKAIK